LGGLPNLHNPRHSDCKGRTTTDFAFDRDVPAHHLTEDLLKKKQEGRPIERPERRESANVVNLMEALRRSVEASGKSTANKERARSSASRSTSEKAEQPKRKKARRAS
jgi:non-homologous end joining protein Ku